MDMYTPIWQQPPITRCAVQDGDAASDPVMAALLQLLATDKSKVRTNEPASLAL